MKSLNLTFSPSFKRAANGIAEELGLENITSERQKENGTICYHDPETNVDYTLHETGYIRRRLRGGTHRAWPGMQPYLTTYQLNPQKEVVDHWTNKRTGETTQSVCTERVALDQWGQLGKLCTSVVSYRQNN